MVKTVLKVAVGVGVFVATGGAGLLLEGALFTAAGVGIATSALGAVAAGLLSFNTPKIPKGSLDQQAGTKFEVRSAVAPRTLVYGRGRIAGTLVYAGTHGTDNKFLSMVFVVAGDKIDSFEKWLLNDELVTLDGSGVVTSGTYANKVRIKFHDGTQTAAETTLVSDVTEWTTDHKLLGLPYYVVRFEFDPEVFSNGRPRVNTIVKGMHLYDPREGGHDPDDDTTWAWSENWALAMLDYLKRDPLGARIPLAEIDTAAIITAANISDEDVTLDIGGTQDRYTLNGVVSTADRRADVINAMLPAGAGRLVFQSGKFTLYAGADTAATLSFDEDDLSGPLKIQTRRSMRELFNRVTGQYIDAANDLYERNNYPAVIDSTAETADGEVLELPLDLPFVQNGIRAQRVAKIALKESRQQLTATMPLNLKGLQIQAWSVIKVTNDLFSWVDKKFRVLGWSLTPDGVLVEMVEYDSAIYAWDESTEEQTVQVPVEPTLIPRFASASPLHSTVKMDQGDGTLRSFPLGAQYITGRDADGITFNTPFANPPDVQFVSGAVSFDGGGLSNTAIHLPAIQAIDVTATGFTIEAKLKETASGITSETDGDGTGSEVAWHSGNSPGPDWQAGKEETVNVAWNNQYEFDYNVTVDSGPEDFVMVGFYHNVGSGWVQDGTKVSTSSVNNALRIISVSGLTTNGSGEEFGMDVEASEGTSVIAEVTVVRWGRATAPATVSATPSGANDAVFRAEANLE